MPELSVIVPTFNEKGNVRPMVEALERALDGIDFEVIFVDDDSPDGTAQVAREAAQSSGRVRVLQRINRRGLASAVVEGMMASSAPYLAVIDGDMQHDESVLPAMLAKLRAEQLDLVIGTRLGAGGSMGEFSSGRVALSQLGRRMSALVCRAELSDPMSGFFVVTRSYLDEVVRELSAIGFKILVDIVASAKRRVRIGEVGYTFRARQSGESKLDLLVGLEYLELLLDKMIGEWIPVRYALFGLVGAVGVAAQLVLVYLALAFTEARFEQAQALASVVVIALNYALNNQLTFRSRRLHGWRWLAGLGIFGVACSVGLASNLRVAEALRGAGFPWLPASFAGILIGSVWNYAVSSIAVWRVNRRAR